MNAILRDPATTRRHPLYRRMVDRVVPTPPVDCVTWNEQHSRISSRDSAEPGPIRYSKTPYFRHWLDLVSARKLGPAYMGDRDPVAHRTEQIWIIKGIQVGGTRAFHYATLSYLIDQHPGPMGYFLPRDSDFRDTQGDRLKPLFEENDQLSKHFPRGVEAMRLNITESAWRLDNCSMYFLSSSNAKDLRSKPLMYSGWDEFDQSPTAVKGAGGKSEGDPMDLGLGRHITFELSRLAWGITSPSWVDGHGWRRLCSGSHERLLVTCPHCGRVQWLDPDRLVVVDPGGIIYTPREASKAGITPEQIKMHNWGRWRCVSGYCAALFDNQARNRLVTAACDARQWAPGTWACTATHPEGVWTPHADFDDAGHLIRIHRPETTIRTGHINSLYSRYYKLSRFVAAEVEMVTAAPAAQRVHRNTIRAEPSMTEASTPAPALVSIIVRSQSGRGTCPPDTQRILTTVDQQGNSRSEAWFPFVTRAWRSGGRTALIDEGKVYGYPALEALEKRAYWVGREQRTCDRIAMDAANGNMRIENQEWAQKRADLRLLVHGRDELSAPVMLRSNQGASKKSSTKRLLSGVLYYYFEPNTWKTKLDALIRAALSDDPQVRASLPAWDLHADLDPEYLASLGSEEQTRRPDRRGRPRLVWTPREVISQQGTTSLREDTHWWDDEMIQLIVAHILKWDNLPDIAPDTTPDQRGAPPNPITEYATTAPAGDWVSGVSSGGW